MKTFSRTIAATAVALACAAAPASAATPFTVGQGSGVHVVAGGDGAGHVAWGIPARGSTPAKIGYCHIPPGGSACDVRHEFDYGVAPGQVAQADPVDVTIHSPSAPKVLIFGACTACGDGAGVDHIYRWYSTTSGTGFSPELMLGTTPTSVGLQADGAWIKSTNLFVSPGEGTNALVFGTLGATATSIPVVGSGFVHSPSTVEIPVLGGAIKEIVQAASNLSSIQYAVFEGGTLDGGTVSDSSNWSAPPLTLTAPEPDSAEPHLSSGPTSTYLTYRRSIPGDNQIMLRRFSSTGNSFVSPTPIQGDDPIDNSADAPDSAQDVSGRIHVVWTSAHDSGRLRYTRSGDAGANFSTPANVAQGETFLDPDVAGAPDGSGWAAWQSGSDTPIRVVRLEPYAERVVTPPPPPPPPPKPPTPKPLTTTVNVSGAAITFGVPSQCVKRGSTFRATLSWKRQKRKGNLFVKVSRVDFYIAGKVVKTDRTAPFVQTLRVTAKATAGSKLTVRARAFIKVKRGKGPTKSITSSITICP